MLARDLDVVEGRDLPDALRQENPFQPRCLRSDHLKIKFKFKFKRLKLNLEIYLSFFQIIAESSLRAEEN